MNAGAPTCPACGGLSTNPQSFQCQYCGSALPQAGYAQAPWPGYGPPPPGYGAQPQAYGQPQGYGQPPPGYAPQAGYGAPPGGGFGAPNPYAAQNPYAAAPNPYGQPQYPGQYQMQGYGVQPFQGGAGAYINRGGWYSGWTAFFWIRLGIAAIVICMSLMGACVSALSH